MQGKTNRYGKAYRLPATLEVKGSNPGPGKINLIKIEKSSNGIRD